MADEKASSPALLLMFLVGVLVGVGLACNSMVTVRDRVWQKECIERGIAEWQAGEDGQPVFTWLIRKLKETK